MPSEVTGKTFADAVAWTAAAKWSTQLVTWASLILVFRLLSPTDVGLVGMTAVFSGFMMMLAEFWCWVDRRRSA